MMNGKKTAAAAAVTALVIAAAPAVFAAGDPIQDQGGRPDTAGLGSGPGGTLIPVARPVTEVERVHDPGRRSDSHVLKGDTEHDHRRRSMRKTDIAAEGGRGS